MRIAILGATSQIAKDLVLSLSTKDGFDLVLFARNTSALTLWLENAGIAKQYKVADFSAFRTAENFDAILNFVGVGDPARAATVGAAIFDITLQYDELALTYVRSNPECRYIFMSSGAAYGSSFESPASDATKIEIAINNVQPQDWYAIAKLHAECRHRAMIHMPIVDVRIFNYFSSTQDVSSRFFITDAVRAIRDNSTLKTSAAHMMRDYLHPEDFCALMILLMTAPAMNTGLDCYSKAPVSKHELLSAMHCEFGLQYEIQMEPIGVNATGRKPFYYSANKKAADFGYKPLWSSIDGVLVEVSKLNARWTDIVGFLNK